MCASCWAGNAMTLARRCEAINDVYSNELRLWLNLFLPSVKLLKKVRVGSKVRRVYDGPQTPLERVRACPQADREEGGPAGESEKASGPVSVGRTIDGKLEGIYRLGQSSPEPERKPEAISSGPGKWLWKRRSSRAWKSKIDFHFPTAAATTNLRLHLKCLDDPLLGLHS